MADEDDYRYALSGNVDLVGSVLDNANFSGASLAGRDFRNSKLKKAIFDKADLTGSDFRGADKAHSSFKGSILTDVRLDGALFKNSFSGAILKGARVSGILHGCDFRSADLSGADFRGARFVEGCLFEGAITDTETNFSGVHVLRPYAKEPIFRDYEFSRGVLNRRETPVILDGTSQSIQDAAQALNRAISLMKSARTTDEQVAQTALIGHNNPPEEFKIGLSELKHDIETLESESAAITAGIVIKARLATAVEILKKYSLLALQYVSSRADMMVSAFATKAGETLGSKTALVTFALYFSDGINTAVQALERLASILPM